MTAYFSEKSDRLMNYLSGVILFLVLLNAGENDGA